MKVYSSTSGKANSNSDKVTSADNTNPTLEDYVIIKETNAWGADYYYKKLGD